MKTEKSKGKAGKTEGFAFTFGKGEYAGHAKKTPEKELVLEVWSMKPREIRRYRYHDPLLPKEERERNQQLPKPWPTFYDHATFKDILNGFTRDPMEDPIELLNLSRGTGERSQFITNPEEFSEKIRSLDDDEFLKLIGKNPIFLEDQNARNRFQDILHKAQYGIGKNREKARDNLELHFLPKHKIPGPVEIAIPLMLLKKLTGHLAKTIKKAIIERYGDLPESIEESAWPETFENIQADLDKRVKEMNQEEILTLENG